MAKKETTIGFSFWLCLVLVFWLFLFFFLATQFIRNGIKNNPRQRSEKDGWQLPAP